MAVMSQDRQAAALEEMVVTQKKILECLEKILGQGEVPITTTTHKLTSEPTPPPPPKVKPESTGSTTRI